MASMMTMYSPSAVALGLIRLEPRKDPALAHPTFGRWGKRKLPSLATVRKEVAACTSIFNTGFNDFLLRLTCFISQSICTRRNRPCHECAGQRTYRVNI